MIRTAIDARTEFCPWRYATQEETNMRCEATGCMAWETINSDVDDSRLRGYCQLIEKHRIYLEKNNKI